MKTVTGKLFSSDWHLGHERNAIQWRGFASAEAHDNLVLDNFLEAARKMIKTEKVNVVKFYFLGDLTSGAAHAETRALSILRGLRMEIESMGAELLVHGIGGNHDSWWGGQSNSEARSIVALESFTTLNEFLRTKIAGERVMMSHFPYRRGGDRGPERYSPYRLANDGSFLLHGHTHFEEKTNGMRSIHVGLDAWDMKPVRIAQIVELIQQRVKIETADVLSEFQP